jgi:hypothetical protein
MKTTYIVEIESHFGYEVINYSTTLVEAKQIALRHKEYNPYILQLKGRSFGEGFHQYRLQLKNNNFICVDVMNLSKKQLDKVY